MPDAIVLDRAWQAFQSAPGSFITIFVMVIAATAWTTWLVCRQSYQNHIEALKVRLEHANDKLAARQDDAKGKANLQDDIARHPVLAAQKSAEIEKQLQ